MTNQNALWTKAADLRKEASELFRKAQWQAGCMANEGRSSAEIDAATATKMARIAEIEAECAETMLAWSAA